MTSSLGMVVVDASVWVARLVQGDAFHEPVKEWMSARRSENTLFISPSLLLPEVVGAISRRTNDRELGRQVAEALENLPGLRLVEMDQTLVSAAASLAGLLGLRGADALYVVVAETLQLPLCTLDEDQASHAAYKVKIEKLL